MRSDYIYDAKNITLTGVKNISLTIITHQIFHLKQNIFKFLIIQLKFVYQAKKNKVKKRYFVLDFSHSKLLNI